MKEYKCNECGEPREQHEEDGTLVIHGCKSCQEREPDEQKPIGKDRITNPMGEMMSYE